MRTVAKGLAKGELIASLLARTWRPSVTSAISISEKQLDEVTPLLYASGAAGLGWWRVKQTELKTTDSGKLLQQAYRLQALQVAIHERQIKKVFSLLRQAAVEPLLVKGWAAASLYPAQALRPYGDIDLLVRPQHFETARAVLAREEASECWIDLHTRFSELVGQGSDELFHRSRLVNLDGEQIRVLAAEDHLALLATHLLKHGAWRPLWLCDIAAAIESIPDEFDWQTCLGNDSMRRTWISVAILLSKTLLGAETDRVSDQLDTKLPNWLVRSVLKQWSNLFPANHLPIQPPPLMAENLRNMSQILKATRERWPDPITATFKLNGSFGSFPRFPYQLGEFSFRAGRFLVGLPKTFLMIIQKVKSTTAREPSPHIRRRSRKPD
jgi:hypothetical protein